MESRRLCCGRSYGRFLCSCSDRATILFVKDMASAAHSMFFSKNSGCCREILGGVRRGVQPWKGRRSHAQGEVKRTLGGESHWSESTKRATEGLAGGSNGVSRRPVRGWNDFFLFPRGSTSDRCHSLHHGLRIRRPFGTIIS